MNESILRALMKLFAIVANGNRAIYLAAVTLRGPDALPACMNSGILSQENGGGDGGNTAM